MAVIQKVYKKFPETQAFIDKAYSEECGKENIFPDQVFLALIIVVDFFMFMMLCFSMVCYEIHYFLLHLIGIKIDMKVFLSKRTRKKDIGEVKKELLQSILEEKPENTELIYKLYHALILENAPKSMKQ